MSSKLIARTLEILKSAAKDTSKDYFSNINTLIDDAKEVRNSITKTTTDAADTFAKIKNTSITKKISDWFYQEENSAESESTGDEEFDPGFKSDNSNESEEETPSTPLTQESMEKINKKNTTTLLKIGRRQNEQSVANTAEIVSTLNARSSEIITAVNNMNKTISGISERLDKIIKIQTVGWQEDKESEKQVDKTTLFDENGKLSLARIFEVGKSAVTENQYVSAGKMFLNEFMTGKLKPEDAVSDWVLKPLLSKIKIGDNSIDEIGKNLNETIGAATQTVMSEFIKSSPFKSLFANMTNFQASKDYGELVPDTYDSKKATFDGMTRKTIVEIIPEMLSKINESVSGVKYHVDSKGEWSSKAVKDEFIEVTHEAFSSSGISNKTASDTAARMKKELNMTIPEGDIQRASEVLTLVIVSSQNDASDQAFVISELNGNAASYIKMAVPILMTTDKDNHGAEYWSTVCQSLIIQLTTGLLNASEFVSNVNKSLRNMHTRAQEFAQSGKRNAKQARQITGAMIKSEYINQKKQEESNKETNDQSTQTTVESSQSQSQNQETGKKKKNKKKEKGLSVDERNAYADKIERGKYDTIDYLHGIFGILNRGINVRIDKANGKYKNYSLDRKNVTQENTDSEMGKMVAAALTGGEKAGESALTSLIESGINKALTGGVTSNRDETKKGAAGSMNLVMTSLLSGVMGGGARSLIDSFIKGEGGQKLKNVAGGVGQVFKGEKSLSDVTEDVRKALPGARGNDQRIINLQNSVNSAPGKIKGFFSRKFNKFLDNNETANKYTNNAIYKKDSADLALANDFIKNLSTEKVSEDDATRINFIREKYEKGEYDNQYVKSALERFDDKDLAKKLGSSFETGGKINTKRKAGEAAIAAGQKAELGAVMSTDKTDFEVRAGDKAKSIAGTIKSGFNTVKSGFSKVGGLLGKIAKSVLKIAKSGIIDIRYGLQSMKEGMFGYKDENGNKHKGLVQQAFTPITAPLNAIRNTAKSIKESGGIYNNIKDYRLGKMFGYRTIDEQMQKIGNIAVSKKRFNTETGEQTHEEVKIKDFIDAPGKALKTSLSNLTDSIKNSGFGKAIASAAKSLKGFAAKVQGVAAKATGWFRNTAFGGGFMKGFDRAKEAKEKAKRVEEEKQYRKEHPTEANIEDALVKNPDSFLGKIHTKFDDLLALLKLNHEEDMEAAETSEENADKRAEEAKATEEEKEEKAEAKEESESAKKDSEETEEGQGGSGGLISRLGGKLMSKLVRRNKAESNESESGSDSDQNEESSNEPKESTVQGSPDVGAVGQTTQPTISGDGGDAGAGGAIGGGGGIKGFLKSAFANIGQMMGGMLQSIMGVAKIVMSALASLSALSAIKEMIGSIWTDGIKPLNKAFYMLKKQLQPIVNTLKKSLQAIMTSVSSMLSVLFDSIKPLMEIIQPVIDSIMSILKPILQLLEAGLGIVLTKIGDIFIKVAPCIEMIADCVQLIAGGLMWGLGTIINIVGGLLAAVGSLISGLGQFGQKVISLMSVGLIKNFGNMTIKTGTGIKNLGDKLGKTGDGLQESAKAMMTEALSNLATHFYELIQPIDERKAELSEGYTPKVDTSQVKQHDEMGAGDVNTNTTTNNSWSYNYNTYGSGNIPPMNQHSYGGYMNMSERGCGPIALADAYARRTGNTINPATLARGMAGSGNYDPRRGSSVGNMLNAGSSLGIGMRLGGVTQSSLNQASPSNPITLLGSGAGFGTKAGNNHYVNVIGTDAVGGAYVSNPMTGRIERTSRSNLALNAKLGLYGSGDTDMYDMADMYGISYDAADNLRKLKEMGERLTAMFTGDSAAVAAEKKIAAAEAEVKAKAIRDKLGDDYAAIEEQAKEALKKNYPKRDGETEDAYQKRLDRLWSEHGATYIIQAGSEAADLKNRSMLSDLTEGVNSAQEGTRDVIAGIGRLKDGASAFIGASMAEFEPINNYQTDIYGEDSDRSPIHDYFTATSGYHSHTKNGGWFNKINDPDKYGQGQKGNKHEGVSLWFDTDEYEDKPEVHAITRGTAVYVGRNGDVGSKDINGGLGNHVKFIDDSGMYHWFLHLADIDDSIQEGSNIEANQLIGHVGNTGATGFDEEGRPGKFLRYILTRSGPYGSTGDKGYENPFKYWDWYEPSDPAVAGTVQSASGGTSGSITAGSNGPALAPVEGGYTYTDVDMDDVYDDSMQNHPVPGSVSGVATYGRHASKHSPVLEFFQKTQPDNAVAYVDSSGYGHWFWNRGEPDKYGKGQKNMGTGLDGGENSVEHGGVDIRWEGGSAGRELHATTGGTVKFVYDAATYSAGNQVGWEDSAGKVHWYIHMRDLPLVKTGDKIEPGQLLGYAGQSGSTSGGYDHLHYTIIDPEYAGVSTSNPNSGMENPIAYFTNFSPTASGTTSAGTADYSKSASESSGNSLWNKTKSFVTGNLAEANRQKLINEWDNPVHWQKVSDSKRESFYKNLSLAHKAVIDTDNPKYSDKYKKEYGNRILYGKTPADPGYWKAGYELTIKGNSPQDANAFAIHVSTLSMYYLGGGVGGPNDTNDMTYLSYSGEIPLSREMSNAEDFWSPYESELSSSGYWEKAASAGLTAGQRAMIAAIGIHEDSAKKLTGKKSLTAITYDRRGQAAVGLMNWIPQNPSGGEDTSFGTTLEEQLKTVVDWYMSSNPKHSRARIMENFNSYEHAMKTAMGYDPKLKIGDLWGQYADTDVVESMGHYVGNALIPEGWNLTTGQAKHMRTAAMAYNWGLKNGKLSGNQTGTTSAGTADYSANSTATNAKRKARFISSMSNYNSGDWITVEGSVGGVGLGTAVNANGGAGGVDAVIQSAVEVADAFNTTSPDAIYKGGNGSLKYRDGSTQSGFRADCSGYTGEILRHMGYYGDTSGNGIPEPNQITGESMGSPRIYDSNGSLTSDWTSMKYDKSKLQRGDILYMGVGDASAHTDMYILMGPSRGYGFNFGNTDDMQKSMKVSTKYLDNGGDIDSMINDAAIGSMPSGQIPTTILRYTVPVTTTSSGTADYSIDSGGNTEKAIWNALIKGGLSPEQAAGMMGNFTHESGLRSNNLEDSKEGGLGYNDESYTSAVDNKKYSKNSFVNDEAGYGLAQWTYWSGKQHLYEKTVEKGKSISDIGSQIDLALTEYPDTISGLKQQKTVRDATLYWMNEYERPSILATENRLTAANKYYNMFRTSAGNANYGKGGPVDNVSYFTSMSGVKMAPYGTPKITETNISGETSGESPVHDFFGQMTGDEALSYGGNWYKYRNNPDKTGTGSSGDAHSGIDINWKSGSAGKKLYAITGGTVDQVQGGGFNGSGSNGGCGNNVRWLDDAGYLHWYMHMQDDPLVKVGDTITPGQLLGYAGDTGNSSGAHLHYNINKAEGFDGWSSSNTVNPLTYWSGYDSNGSSVEGSTVISSDSSIGSADGLDFEAMLRTRKLSGAAVSAKQRGRFSNASYWDKDVAEYVDNEDEHMSYEDMLEIINNLTPDLSEIYTMAAINAATDNAANSLSSSKSSSSSSISSSSGSSGSSDSGSETSSSRSGSFLKNYMTNMKNTVSELSQVKKLKDQNETPGAMASTVSELTRIKNGTTSSNQLSPTAYDPTMPFDIWSAGAYSSGSGADRNTAFAELDKRYDIVRGLRKSYNPNITYDKSKAPKLRHRSTDSYNLIKDTGGNPRTADLRYDSTIYDSAKDWQYSYHSWTAGANTIRDGFGYGRNDFPSYISSLHHAYLNNTNEYGATSHGGGGYTRGSGDAPSEVSTYIPPLDISQLYDGDIGTQQNPVIINNYEVTRDDSDKLDIIDKMSKMTFNVRAERVEQLLEELIKTVKNGQKEKNVTTSNVPNNNNLFRNDQIPAQITRLAMG